MIQEMFGPMLRALSSTILSYHTRIPVKELACITIFVDKLQLYQKFV